jgi:hypothetical protein
LPAAAQRDDAKCKSEDHGDQQQQIVTARGQASRQPDGTDRVSRMRRALR